MAPVQAALPDTDPAVSQLATAFQTFSASSHRLVESYRVLQERVRRIDRQLLDTNERLNRKVAELNSLTTYLNEILSGMHNGVVGVDRQGCIVTFNRAAERVLGVRAADAAGQPYPSVVTSLDGTPSPLAAALADGEAATEVEREVADARGQRRRLTSSAAPIRDAQGALVGAVEIFSDITEFRQLQARLDHADKLAALGEMAAQVAHEIRNPLNGIEGFATLLLRDLDDGDPRRGFAHHILTGARSLNTIVGDMLLFCRPCTLHARPVHLRHVLEEALTFVVDPHAGGGLRVCRDYDAAADPVVADPDQLRQAFMNLLLNATQAMGHRGRLRVATRRVCGDADRVEVRICDSGPGIPHEVAERVFDPFFTTKSTGTGLGLAIVQKIVRLHGGDLRLESPSGHGTVAVVTLARHAPDPLPAA